MIRLLLSAALFATTLSAIPAGAQAAGSPRQTATVTCFRAHLYLVRPADDRPYPIDNTRDLTQGQTLEILSPTRTTLQSVALYETSIPIVELGPGFVPHYFVQEPVSISARRRRNGRPRGNTSRHFEHDGFSPDGGFP